MTRSHRPPKLTMQVVTPFDLADLADLADLVTPGDSPQAVKNYHAVELGRLGGLKGGRARAEALSAEQRREIARKAAQTRWKNGNR
jgi:hypothetical protein